MRPEENEALEQELMTLSRSVAYPATPDLAAGFWRRLQRQETQQPAPSRLSLAGLALAAAVVAVSALVATVTPARDAAADLFDRINVFQTSEPISGLPRGVRGEETTLAAAEAAIGQDIAEPTYPNGLTLERVVLQDFGIVKAAVLFYRRPDGAEFALFATNGQVGKGLPTYTEGESESAAFPGTTEAYWFTGTRRVEYRDEDGVIEESVRQTGKNALVWEHEGFVYRLEGDLERDEAVEIAQSVR